MAPFRDVKDVRCEAIHPSHKREIQTIPSLSLLYFSRKLFSSRNFIRILPILIHIEASLFAFFLSLWSKRMMLLEYESVLSAC